MKRLLILLASLFLILACGAKKGGYTKLPSDTPDWVIKGGGAFKSEKGTALYGVGINTFDPNPAMHRQTADARARQDLAKIIDTYVGSLMKDFMQSHKDFQNPEASSSVQFVSVVSKNVTDATLSGSQIIDHWTDKDGETVISKLDESMLRRIAAAGEGSYIRSTDSRVGLDKLFQEINRMEKQELESRIYSEYEERFVITGSSHKNRMITGCLYRTW